MKTALCISGELRTFNNPNVIDNLKKYILDDLTPDVFLSVWDHVGMSIHQEKNFDSISKTFNVQELYNIYGNIKSVNVENLDNWLSSPGNDSLKDRYRQWSTHKNSSFDVATTIPHFYKVYDTYKLKKDYETNNNVNYDLVIKMRPDLLFVNYINKEIRPNTVYHNKIGRAHV